MHSYTAERLVNDRIADLRHEADANRRIKGTTPAQRTPGPRQPSWLAMILDLTFGPATR